MLEKYDDNSKYYNIYNRFEKKFSSFESFIIIKNLFFTDNIIYYFFCIIFRFISLIILSGDYISIFTNNNIVTLRIFLKKFTCYHLFQQINGSYLFYCIIHAILLSLFIFRVAMNFYLLKKFHNYKYTQKWPIPCKYKIIIDHIIHILYPYIIEFLSFPFYMYFFPNKFIIKYFENFYIFFLMLMNFILIICYNYDNYLNFISSNKVNSINFFDAYLQLLEEKINRPIAYKTSNFTVYFFTFLQNFTIFLNLENCLNKSNLKFFKLFISIIISLSVIILIISKANEFNYNNLINKMVYILLLFCLYSILFDFIIYILKYRIRNHFVRVIYNLFKIFISYNTFFLIKLKNSKFLESKIIEILFQEKINRNKNYFIDSLYYLHHIMLKLNQKHEIKMTLLLISFLNDHINKCKKTVCNCKLIRFFIKNEKKVRNEEKELKNFSNNLLNILSYLFESIFIEIDYYNKYDLSILLSEHFCHIKNNPIMAYSLINTLILKQRNNFSKVQMIELYELSQKYLNFFCAKDRREIEINIKEKKLKLILDKLRINEKTKYYNILKISYVVKKLILKYIDNQIKLLKYKIIFEDSISFQYDENNENIFSVKLNFFKQSIKIEDLYDDSKKKKLWKNDENTSNLYFILYLLKKENFYHLQILNSIKQLEINQNIPAFIIFKFFLFFDIFGGGKMPEDVPLKLYNFMNNKTNLYNSDITNNEYSILIKRYKEQNNRINSKYFAIFEYKKELKTKYYSEEFALKLGFMQKDIINKKIDELMPKEFANCHQNLIKHLIIGNQIKTFNFTRNFFFDSSGTVLYPVSYNGNLIYNISRNLNIIFEWTSYKENKFNFMLNSNFELMAISKNFEDEYFLNQKILKQYDIKIMNILKIKEDKLKNRYFNDYKNIRYQKLIRQVKTEEYFIPQLYVPKYEKSLGIMNPSFFNNLKNNIISKLTNSSNITEDLNENQNEDLNESNLDSDRGEEEKNKLLKNNRIKNLVFDILIKKGTISFHGDYKTSLNKLNFVKNLSKELSKIEDHEINYEDEKDSYNNNLILASKKLINKLLGRFEISNDFLKINVKMSFYYDKIFYFVDLEDIKKFTSNVTKKLVFENFQNLQSIKHTKTSTAFRKNLIPFNKDDLKSRNKRFSINKNLFEEKNKLVSLNLQKKELENTNKDEILKKFTNELENNDNKKEVIKKINQYRAKINRDKFIFIIRLILSIIIVAILIIYILIMIFSDYRNSIESKILLTYFYNSHTKDFLLCLFSKLLQIFYDHSDLAKNPLSDLNNYQKEVYNYSCALKDNYHKFMNIFSEYNLIIGKDLKLIYIKQKFMKLRGFWKETEYESEYISELDYIIFNAISLNMSKAYAQDSKIERQNFIFFRERNDTKEKATGVLIKLLYYLCSNYEFGYSRIFNIIEKEIYNNFLDYNHSYLILYIILEFVAAALFISFYIAVLFFLVFSNEILIKNIVFLFLDFSENTDNENRTNSNLIILKLLELQKLINDFNLNNLEKYSKNIDNININKSIYLNNKDTEINLNSNINNVQNEENKNDKITPTSNKSSKNIKYSKSIKFEFKKFLMKHKSKNFNEQNKENNIKENKFTYIENKKVFNSIDSNPHLLKEKISTNSISASNEFLVSTDNNSNNIINNKNILNSKKNFMNTRNQSLKPKINEEEINIQEIILNESKKNIILITKIYSLIIIIFIVLTISFGIAKFIFTFHFNNSFKKIFLNFSVVSNRYNIIYYYFNTLRTLLIFPEGRRKQIFEEKISDMMDVYENENNKFNKILLSGMKEYNHLKKTLYFLKQSKESKIDDIKENICNNNYLCLNYLNSEYNIFGSGIDFTLQSSVNQINSFFMEYQKLKNKTDINEINRTIINSPSSQFVNIGLSLGNLFFFVKEKIFDDFKNDAIEFRKKFSYYFYFLNSVSIAFSIISFLFINIFIFISLYRFSKPIKESSYRINCSFFNIKKYRFSYSKF